MATVNRYTKYTTPRYDPLSLQEIMMVPAYKRQQHNAIQEGLSEYETQLAQVDPLDIHSDLARQRQEELYNKISEQASRLASEGFSSTAKTDFINMNKQYQQEVGPMGTIGKINRAKQIYEQQKADSIANAVKQGFSPEEAAAQWELHSNAYNQGFDGKNITNIDGMFAPEYKDYISIARELFKEAGGTASDITEIGSNIVYDPNLGSYVVTTKDRDANKNNLAAMQAVADYMNNQVTNPNSTVGKSIAFQRKNPNDVLKEIAGLDKIYQKTETIREDARQISNFTPIKTKDELTSNGGGLVVAGTQYTPAKFTGLTYADLENTVLDLESLPNRTPEQDMELLEMKAFQESVKAELQNVPKYVELDTHVKEVQARINAINRGTFDWSGVPQVAAAGPISNEHTQLAKDLYLQKEVQDLNATLGEISELSKGVVRNAKIQVTEYSVFPVTEKQEQNKKRINENADELLRVNPQSLEQLGDINQIIDPNGKVKQITDEKDRQGIANLIFNSKPGSINVVSYVARGASGKPEVVFRIETDEDNAYDLQGVLGSSNLKDVGFTGDIGGGKPVQIRMAFDTTKNEVGVNNLLGELQNYLATTGPMGQQFVESQKINQMRAKYSGMSWERVMDDGYINQDNDLKLLYREALRKEGATSTSTPEEIQAAQDRLRKKQVMR